MPGMTIGVILIIWANVRLGVASDRDKNFYIEIERIFG